MAIARTLGPIVGAVTLALAAPVWAESHVDVQIDLDLPAARSLWQLLLLLVNLDEVVETVAFYTCLMAVSVMVFGVTIALRQREWSGYTGLAAFGLVWIAFNDQNLSGIYWSGVELSQPGLIVLGYVMVSCNFAVAAWAIPRRGWQQGLRWPLVALAVLCWSTWLLGRDMPEPQALLIFNATAVVGGLSHAVPFSTFTRIDGQPDRLLRAAAAVIGVCAVAAAGVVSAGILGAEVDIIFVNRVLILLIVIFLCVFFALRIMDIRRDREAVIARSLADARREAQISRELLVAQQEHARTRDIARLQRLRLAEASHDIRQPITSLRTTMDALTARQPPKVKEQLRRAFDYLDQLAGSYIDEARADAPLQAEEDAPPVGAVDTGTETVSAVLLMQTLDAMFREEAQARDRPLQVLAQDIPIRVPPLATMRILSNLIANAITHSAPGPIAVSIGVRGPEAVFEIVNSGQLPQGPVFDAYEKGDASPGEGLGLAIVQELARRHGLSLTHSSDQAERTVFALGVPLADPVGG